MENKLILVSHALCPYVQRVAIVLEEKGIAYQRIDIDLKNKPAWFLGVSPLAKTPVLLVDGQALFESSVICEYLEETHKPKLHPENALLRAQQRAWMEFGTTILNAIAGFYNAGEEHSFAARCKEIREKFIQVETVLQEGPFFAGAQFCMVDAVFAPVLRYFDVVETIYEMDFFSTTPKVRAWRRQLAQRTSVKNAVATNYPQLLRGFLLERPSMLARSLA